MAVAPRKRRIKAYEHADKQRANNPEVGLVTVARDRIAAGKPAKKTYKYDPHIDPALEFDSQGAEVERILDAGLGAQTLDDAKAAIKELKKRSQPYLNWAGKAERTSFEVPTVSLHVHERIDPRTIIQSVRSNGVGDPLSPRGQAQGEGKTSSRAKPRDLTPAPAQLPLFEQPRENRPLREAVEFYRHPHGWSNRLIAGDSLLVMNSLLEKEGMAGKVQMVYMDPPYGIRYRSNFQPFVDQRNVGDRDEDLTAEPEQIRAFRDTWELGIHSYMTYLRDRLLLARELLTESGSVFVQISDENVHHVRELMDEVFGAGSFVALIAFATTSGFQASALARAGDYVLWYARDMKQVRFRQQYFPAQRIAGEGAYRWIHLRDSSTRAMTRDEIAGNVPLPVGARLYRPDNIISQGSAGAPQPFEFRGKTYSPPANSHWKANYPVGMERLARANRIHVSENSLRYIRYADDFPWQAINNMWDDTLTGQFTESKVYVVQTNTKVIQRCLLMTTDPGDLVFDPTCGSGTTASVAEEWGRRWITCDTSRVAITLAKQRLMTANFDYYELARPDEGVGSGFKYKTVPHVTLKSIANNEPPQTETLYDQPLIDKAKVRVTGPFTAEAVPAPVVLSPDEAASQSALAAGQGEGDGEVLNADLLNTGETLRHSEWRAELLKTGIRATGGTFIKFTRVEPLGGTRWLHAESETQASGSVTAGRALVSFGPENAPLEQRQVEAAIDEALKLFPRPKFLVFAAFQFDPEAAKDIDEARVGDFTLLKAQMSGDLLTEDLKKARASNDSFWLIGQPDVAVLPMGNGQFKVEVRGFDYYDPRTGQVESGDRSRIAMWLLDTDYDGRSLYPRQVFFPLAGSDPSDGWNRLARTLKAEIDSDLIDSYRGTQSLPFPEGMNRRVAVKIIDNRGVESLRVLDLPVTSGSVPTGAQATSQALAKKRSRQR